MPTHYSFPCILLSGMPGTGKDTLSQKLVEREPSFTFFKKHRANPSLSATEENDTYISISPEAFHATACRDEFIQYHSRYGKMYGVSKEQYVTLTQSSRIPLIHVGKYENVQDLRTGGLQEGLSLLLWADRNIVRTRLQERHRQRADSVEERLLAYDEEIAQLKHYASQGALDFDLIFVNNGADPDMAVEQLLSLLQSHSPGSTKETQAQLCSLLCV